MEEIEDPIEMCKVWTEHAAPIISPPSLTNISLRKVKHMIKMFSLVTEESSKLLLGFGLKNLFDIPGQFVPEFLETLLQSIQNHPVRANGGNIYPTTDKERFLIEKKQIYYFFDGPKGKIMGSESFFLLKVHHTLQQITLCYNRSGR